MAVYFTENRISWVYVQSLSVLVKSDAIGGQVECKGGHVKCNFASGGSEQKLQAV